MINKKIFKTEFLRKDNSTFEKKYRLWDKEEVEKNIELFSKILDSDYFKEDYSEVYKKLIEKNYGVKT